MSEYNPSYYKEYYKNNIEKIRERRKIYHVLHREKISKKRRVWAEKLRQDVYDILGVDVCMRCNFSDKRALQFDHINGGGTKRRYENALYKELIRYRNNPDLARKELQVLCANCNTIKIFEKREWRNQWK